MADTLPIAKLSALQEPAPIGAPDTATFTYLGKSVTLDPSDFGKYVEDRKLVTLMLTRIDAEAKDRASVASSNLKPKTPYYFETSDGYP